MMKQDNAIQPEQPIFFLKNNAIIESVGLKRRCADKNDSIATWDASYLIQQKWDLILDYFSRLDPKTQLEMLVDEAGKFAPFLMRFIDSIDGTVYPRPYRSMMPFIQFWNVLSPVAKYQLMHTLKGQDYTRFMTIIGDSPHFFKNEYNDRPLPLEFCLSFLKESPPKWQQHYLEGQFFSYFNHRLFTTSTGDAFNIIWPQIPESMKEKMLQNDLEVTYLSKNLKSLVKKRTSNTYAKYLSFILNQEPNRYYNGMLAQQGILINIVASYLDSQPIETFVHYLSPQQLERFSLKLLATKSNGFWHYCHANFAKFLMYSSPYAFLPYWDKLRPETQEKLWERPQNCVLEHGEVLNLLETAVIALPDDVFIKWVNQLPFNELRWQHELKAAEKLPILAYEQFGFNRRQRHSDHIRRYPSELKASYVLSMALCFKPRLLPVLLSKLPIEDVALWVKSNPMKLYALKLYPKPTEEKQEEKEKKEHESAATTIEFSPTHSMTQSYVLEVDFTQGSMLDLEENKRFSRSGARLYLYPQKSIYWAFIRNDIKFLEKFKHQQPTEFLNLKKQLQSDEITKIVFCYGHVETFSFLNNNFELNWSDKWVCCAVLTGIINFGYREGATKAKPISEFALETIQHNISTPEYQEIFTDYQRNDLMKLGCVPSDLLRFQQDQWMREIGYQPCHYLNKKIFSQPIILPGVDEIPDKESDLTLISIKELRNVKIDGSVCLLDWDTFFKCDASDETRIKIELIGGQKTLKQLKKLRDSGIKLIWSSNHLKSMARKYVRILHQTIDPTSQQFNLNEDILNLFFGLVYLKPGQTKKMILDAFDDSRQGCEHCYIVDADVSMQQKAIEFDIMPVLPKKSLPDALHKITASPRGREEIGWKYICGVCAVELVSIVSCSVASIVSINQYTNYDKLMVDVIGFGVGFVCFLIAFISTMLFVHRHNQLVAFANNRDAFFNNPSNNNIIVQDSENSQKRVGLNA